MKKLFTTLGLALSLLASATLRTPVHAQSQFQIPAYAYQVESKAGSFTDISNAPGVVQLGTDLKDGSDLKDRIFLATSTTDATPTSKSVTTNTATAAPSQPAFPLGFDFKIGGKPLQYFVVSALGGAYFSDSPLQVPTNSLPTTYGNTNCIFAYPYQFASATSTSTAMIGANIATVKPGQAPACYLISGTEGDHVLTVQHDYLLNGKDEWIFQFKYYEASGNVEFIVKQMTADNAIAGKTAKRYELGLSLVETASKYLGHATATTNDPLASINVEAPISSTNHLLRRFAIGQSAAISTEKGWDTAYMIGAQLSNGRMFIDAEHFPEEGRTISFIHPTPCPEKAPRLSAEHYSITNETFTESSYTANLSFNTARIPDAQTLFNSGTILAVLSDREIPAYTLSNGTLYKKGDKIGAAEVLCNQLPKVAYGNYQPLGYRINTPIAISVTGLGKGVSRFIHLYAMSYHCDGSPVYSELCHTIAFSTAIDMPSKFAIAGLPTANSVKLDVAPANGYGVIIVKSRKSTPPSLSGNLAKGDMIGQDAQVMEILNTAATPTIPLDENERCHLFAYTADLSAPDAPLYAPNALSLSVRAAYPGLPGLIDFTGEAYTTLDPRDPNFAKTFRDLPIGWTRETAVAENIRNYAFGLGKPGYDNRLKTALYAQVNGSKTSKTEFDVVTPPIVCDKDHVLVTYNVAMLQSPSAGSSETDVYAIDPNANDEFKIEYKIEEGAWISCASFTGDNLPEISADGFYPLEARIEASGLKGQRLSLRYSYKGVTRTHSDGDYSSYNSIGSIDIKELKPCSTPSGILETVALTTDTEATLTWTDNNSPAATAFSVFYKPEDNTAEEYLQMTVNAPTATPNNLKPYTLYSVYVVANCGEKGESYNSQPASFTTLHSFPYTETMAQDPNIIKIINGKPVSVAGPGPFARGLQTATGELPSNTTTAATLDFITDALSDDNAFNPFATWARKTDPKALPTAVGAAEYVKNGWLITPRIYIGNNDRDLRITFKANTAQQIDNEWVKGSLPAKFNQVKLYVMVSNNGQFTREDIVETFDISGTSVIDKQYTVTLPAKDGVAHVAFYLNNPAANPKRDEAEGKEPPAMLFEIYDLAFEYAGHSLSLDVTPENAGTVTGNGQYNTGESVTITATANENYVFVAWMDGDKTVSTQANYTFDMPDQPLAYTAKFRPTIHNVTVLIKPNREEGTVSGEGKHKEDTDVTLTATPKNGYRFKAWMDGDAELSKDNPYTFTMPTHDVTYSAVFEPLYTLTLNETPLNAGTVTGENSYGVGDKVTITATPNENYAFVAWKDGDQVVSTEASLTFDMPAKDLNYTAEFRSLIHNLTLNILPGREAGQTSGGGSFKEGTQVTVEAEAYDGYRFVAWMDGDTELSKDNPYKFEMPAQNTTYEAVFEPLYALSLLVTPENAGNVTGNGQYAKDESVTIAATANENYVFVAWMDGDKTVSTETTYTFDMPAEPLTYTAKFRPTVHNVTVLIKPDREAGTVSGEGNHKENTDVTLTATPKNGYRFKAWMNGDAELSKDNPYTFTMPAENVTYSAAFEPLYTLTLDRTPGGTVTGANSYGAGDKVTIEATPESDYTFVAWMNGDEELSKDNPYTFDMPAQNTTYKAVFEANAPDPETFHVMLNMTPNGAGTVSGEATYKEGDKVSITATANENYAFVAWKDGDQVVSTEANHTFDMPAKNVTYTAEFRSLIHNLTLNILPGREAGNTTGGGSFKEGTQVSVTATANDGYRFVAWMDGDTELSKDNPYKFEMPAQNTTYKAVFEPLYALSLLVTPENAGNVTGNGQYAKDESVTITATANENYVFVAWMDGDKTVSTQANYTFDMPAEPLTYTAKFRPTIHNVTVLIKPNREEGTVSGEGKHKENTDVTLTATPKNGYRFKAWMDGDAELSKDNPYTFTMPTHDVTYSAVFEPLYTLTLSETPLNAGTVTGENSYGAGDKVTITATPNENYAFVAWKDGDQVVSTEASHTFDMPAKDLNYTAVFRSMIHNLTLNILPGREAGMTTGGGSFKEGTQVTVKATAFDGYRFVAWMDGDEIVSTQNPYTFTMPDTEVLYTALFEAIGAEPETFDVTLTVTPENAGTVTGNGQHATGESVTIAATANEGYQFVAWKNADKTVSTEATYTFLMPAHNVAYTAVFEAVKPVEPETFNLTLNATPQNAGTVTGNGRYAAGASVLIKAEANEGYQFVAWKNGDETVSTEANHTFSMPAKDVAYTAVFEAVKPIEPETFNLTLNATPQNAGTVTGNGRYAAGASVLIKAEANEGYKFVAWINGGDTVSTQASHTFTMPAQNVTYTAVFVAKVANEKSLKSAFSLAAIDGKLHIRNLNGMTVKTVEVYSLNGQKLHIFAPNSRENLALPLDAERMLLIVRITTEQGAVAYKVLLP